MKPLAHAPTNGEQQEPVATPLLSRLVVGLYLASIALLPWSWFPPFPWLHEHAQWSDAVFALAALVWGLEKWQTRTWPRWRPFHLAIALYLSAATLSLLFATPDKQLGAAKLLGMAELGVLAVITADVAQRTEARSWIVCVIAVTALLSALAAWVGLVLFYCGIQTELIGTYGDLVVSPWYARMQAGTTNPNMLASFCIFAAAVVAQRDVALPHWLRRIAQMALGLTVLLTFSRSILTFALAVAIRRARTRVQKALVVAAAVACLALFGVLTIGNLSLNPARPTQTHWNWNEASDRWQGLMTSYQTLVARPWFGSGVGHDPGWRAGRPYTAHFTPLNLAATLGFPALLAFLAIFLSAWRTRLRPTEIAIWSGLAGLAVDAFVEDIEDFRHLWVLLGLAVLAPTPQANNSQPSYS